MKKSVYSALAIFLICINSFAGNPFPAGSTWDAFGDSITAGDILIDYFGLVRTATGWTGVNHGIGGSTAYRQGVQIYALSVGQSTLSSSFIGTNDTSFLTTTARETAWRRILEAEYIWLLTPTKSLGQALSVTGTWANSDINPSFGIKSATNGSTATASVSGSTVYVGFWATLNNAASVNVTIDSVDKGQFTPATLYTDSQSLSTAPFAIRISGLSSGTHTVVVTLTAANASTLYLDYITSNGNQLTGAGPVLYVLTPYLTASETIAQRNTVVSNIQIAVSEISSDGLGIQLVNVTDACEANCHNGDGIHPDAAGYQIIANAMLAAIANLWNPARSPAYCSNQLYSIEVMA